MVYIPRLTFKSGINPSILAKFPTNGIFGGTHKLMLTRTRIFGDKISGHLPSGMKVWRSVQPARFEFLNQQKIKLHDLYRDIPGLKEVNDENLENETVRKYFRQQMKMIKQSKKAAKDTKKKK